MDQDHLYPKNNRPPTDGNSESDATPLGLGGTGVNVFFFTHFFLLLTNPWHYLFHT